MTIPFDSDLFNKTCTLQTLSATKSATGERTKSFNNKEVDVICGVNKSIELDEMYARMGISSGLRFYFISDHSLNTTDRIIYDSQNYDIRVIHNVNQRDELWQVDTERVDI